MTILKRVVYHCEVPQSLSRAAFWIGLIVLIAYWYFVHPTGWFRGYMEDLCGPEIVRQLMAEQLQRFGHPGFVYDQVMTPKGISMPYMSWMIERDWIGAYFWMWNRDFPFQWFWFGVSLLGSYLGVGYFLRRARLGPGTAWALASAVVLLHIPRHFKIWHHSEHLLQHWLYWSVFIDVLVLQRLFRERRFSAHLELWRGVFLLGMLWTAGYYWGPLILEWVLVRGLIALEFWNGKRLKKMISLEFARRPAALAIVAGFLVLLVDLSWYLPLFEEFRKQPDVIQPMSWFARPLDFLFPLWYAKIPGHLDVSRNLTSETLIAIGWSYWIPFALAVALLGKKRGGPGLKLALPFLACLLVAFTYTVGLSAPLVQSVIPFMRFFRVAVRWGLILPPLVVAVIALAWPEISAWYRRRPRRVASALFLIMLGIEASWLTSPVLALPPLPETVTSMLEKIRQLPGDTVLNLPFCTAGGNGVCTGEQCPNYPYSTVGACFRGWHDKKVHGLYAARLMDSQCGIYRQTPFQSWFASWREGRCLTDSEWSDFCAYLSSHSEISAILVYPDIWTGAGTPECRARFDTILGAPLGEASFSLERNPGGFYLKGTRVLWYQPACGGGERYRMRFSTAH